MGLMRLALMAARVAAGARGMRIAFVTGEEGT
jgi:hypothetical protein